MMSDDTTGKLTEWIHDCAERNGVRVAAYDEDGWVDRERVRTNVDVFNVELDGDPEKRYTMLTERDNLRLDCRTRFQFRVIGVNENQKLQREGLVILVEVPETEQIPDFTDCVHHLCAEILQRVDSTADADENYRSVAGNRVAGLDAEKQRLSRFLDAGNSDWGLIEPTGIILEGPPGTGKTELVMELCQEKYGQLPTTISGPEVLSKWVGETEQHLREAFEETLDSSHRVLYIDELDAIARTRTESNQDHLAQLVSQLLVLLDGVDSKDSDPDQLPLRVIASTNIAQVIDPALRRPGRLGNRPIQVGRPSEQERMAIIHHYLENIQTSEDGRLGSTLERAVTYANATDVLRRLSVQMEGFSGADIEDAVQEAVSKVQASEQETLTIDFFEKVLQIDFSRSTRYHTREFTSDELGDGTTDSVDADQMVLAVNGSSPDAEPTAKRYFSALMTDSSETHQYVFRQVSPQQLLGDDKRSTRDRTASVFQHLENERVCVYLEDIKTLYEAREYSGLVGTIIEVLNEQLVRWNDDNVLLIDETEQAPSIIYSQS